MKNVFVSLGGAAIIFATAAALIITYHSAKLRFFDINSPYVAAFAGLGIAIGILFAMIMIVMHNYQQKLYDGQTLVTYAKE